MKVQVMMLRMPKLKPSKRPVRIEMRIVRLRTIAVVAFSMLLSDGAFSDELSERAAIRNEVGTLIAGEQFSALEALSARYRTSKSRTSSGIWHLTLFYSGVSSAFHTDRKEQEFWLKADRSATRWVVNYPDSATGHLAYARMLLNQGS